MSANASSGKLMSPRSFSFVLLFARSLFSDNVTAHTDMNLQKRLGMKDWEPTVQRLLFAC